MTHRTLLIWGVLLLAVGLGARTFAGTILAAYTDYLGDPISLQLTAVNVVLDTAVVVGIPLGCALIAGACVVKTLAAPACAHCENAPANAD